MLTDLFFTFEGGEGSGKTTLIHRLADYLEKNGHKVLVTREPGGSEIAEEIRTILLKDRETEADPMTDAILFLASRNEHLHKTVIPALKAGKIVLMDRYVDSSLVYQGIVSGLGVEQVWQLNAPVVGKYMPKHTFLLDVNPEIGIRRTESDVNRERNKLDRQPIEFHRKICEGYQMIAHRFPERVTIIDGNRDEINVLSQVEAVIFDILKKQNNGRY